MAYNDWHHRARRLDPDEDRLGLIGIGLRGDQGQKLLTDPNGVRFAIA